MNYDSLPTNVYYDVNIINNDQTGTKAPPRLVFQDIRTQPIVSYPELYELSVVRFNLATANSLPLWIPSIQLDQTSYNPNLTTYSFTLVYQYGDVRFSSGQVFVQYIPCNLAEPVPNRPAQTAAEIHVPYYFVHSFNTIVEMFNNGLAEAFQLLKDDAASGAVNLPTQQPPFFEWDSDNSKFILNGDVVGFDSRMQNHISIYCNTALYTLISGFQADYYGVLPVENGMNYRFKLTREIRGLNLFTIITDVYSVIQLYQEYSSAQLFTPVASIVFTTSLLPILASNTTKPVVFNGDGSLVSSGLNNNISSMITDFEAQDNNGYGFSGSISYIPASEYRMIDLNQGSGDRINNIDIMVFWKDEYSNLHPMYLLPGCKCDIKILFRKKKYNG